jgi:hypothetical protein
MKSNCLINTEDVANELGISKGHTYKVIRQLYEELEKSGFIIVAGKVPRAFWEKKFYGYQTSADSIRMCLTESTLMIKAIFFNE